MPIVTTDLKYYLPINVGPSTTIGGTITGNQITSGAANNLWDDVSTVEGSSGDTEYRCCYIKNANVSLSLTNTFAWISAQTSGGHTISIGLDPAGNGGTATTITSESVAPAGVTFSSPTTKATGLSIGTLTPNQARAIWWRRVVTAGSGSGSGISPQITVEGDTPA
jgi:hypothetical protein